MTQFETPKSECDGYRFLYFAYGSNLHPRRLSRRTPSARVLCQAALFGHRLRFHKLGRDGSGKCDAHPTGNPADRVHGALYRIDEGERAILDRAESLGVGYDACLVQVQAGRETLKVWTYLAREQAKVRDIQPFHWYLELVLHGALYHGLPDDYVWAIARSASSPDPDARRDQANRDILLELQSDCISN